MNDETRAERRFDNLRKEVAEIHADICESLGKATGTPWTRDDTRQFPLARIDDDDQCLGQIDALLMADLAAKDFGELKAENERYRAAIVAMLDAFEHEDDRLIGRIYRAREGLKKVLGRPCDADLPLPDFIVRRGARESQDAATH